VDDWAQYASVVLVEEWQRNALRHLRDGCAVQFTVRAVVNEPLKFEITAFYKDQNWPGDTGNQQPRVSAL